jgi:hypothetical protein
MIDKGRSVGWQRGEGNEEGEEPASGSGAHGGQGPSGAASTLGGPVSGEEAVRDERLSGFARGGEWDSCLPGPELAALLAGVAGANGGAPVRSQMS